MAKSDHDGSGRSGTLGIVALVALATGGMVGGGIYVALGVVVESAGRWSWLAFVIAGVVAVSTAYTYASLSNHFNVGGGAFAFLEQIDRRGAAGSLSWVLLAAYTLTIALYAYAFGEYVSHALGLSAPWPRLLAVGSLVVLTSLNLGGLGKIKGVEIAIVSVNLLVLLGLAVVGLGCYWSPGALSVPGDPKSPWAAWMGAAIIFVAYEGFQLLTYEYEQVDEPQRILPPGLVGSAVAVVVIYVLVSVGATMIAGAETIVDRKGVALSTAAEQAAGLPGLMTLTIAAAFATSAAINSTLFSSAKLANRVAADGELPTWFKQKDDEGVPVVAMVLLGVVAAGLAWIGSLSGLVEAASLAFLTAFGAVHAIAWKRSVGQKWVTALACAIGGVIAVLLLYRLATTRPIPLTMILGVFAVSFFVRPWLLRHAETTGDGRTGEP